MLPFPSKLSHLRYSVTAPGIPDSTKLLNSLQVEYVIDTQHTTLPNTLENIE